MAPQSPQSFEHHTRFLPGFHFVAFPLVALNFLYAAYEAVAHFGLATVVGLAFAIGVLLVTLFSRLMAVTVQDRVIRLEERLRLRALLPADLQGRIDDFSVKQLVAMRFASDGELPALARKVLDERLEDQKAIKRLVKNWRADYQRA
jgi:hypothetical protein